MKNLIYLILLSVTGIFFSGCLTDPNSTDCTTDCSGNGSCNNNVCNCFLGYMGTNCESSIVRFIVDSVIVRNNSSSDGSGNPIETAGEGDPDLFLKLILGTGSNTVHTTLINNEVPVSEASVFSLNWQFSVTSQSFYYQAYSLKLYDDDNGTVENIRNIYFDFGDFNNSASKTLSSNDGLFEATFYLSYE